MPKREPDLPAENTREREGILIGVGAGLTLVALLVLQSLVGSGLFSTRTVTTTTTVTAVSTAPDAYDQVASSYANHLSLLNSSNSAALKGDYESNATVEWTGEVPGLVGNYTGQLNIGILIGSFREKFVNFSLSNESQTMAPKGTYWVVSSTFDISGYSSVVGNTNIAITAEDSYAHVGNGWLIAHETWNFLKFNQQFPVR
jgi:hypothetical protein